MQTIADALKRATEKANQKMNETQPKYRRRSYDKKIKAEAVRRFKAGEKCTDIAAALGVPASRVQGWCSRFRLAPYGRPRTRRAAAKAEEPEVETLQVKASAQLQSPSQLLGTVRIILTSTSLYDNQKIAVLKALLQ